MTQATHTWIEPGHRFSKVHQFNEDQVRAFATDAGDTNPLHHDSEIAAASRYKKLIASGTHTTALILGLTAAHFSENYSVVGVTFSVEFHRPVFADATVQIEWVVESVSMRGEKAQWVNLRGGMTDEDGNLCVQATGTVRISAPNASRMALITPL